MSKIIIVEDDPMISEIYEKKFKESGFEVFTSDSGDQVLALVKKEKIDLILLDLIMPKLNGFEVIEVIRSGDNGENVKIIVFSNLSQKEDRDKAMKLGANGFLTKSDYTPTNLVKEVVRLLNQFSEEKKNEERVLDENGQWLHSDSASAAGKSILIIEDEEVFIDMFGDKLRQDGYTVVSASNGVTGLKEALSGDYDLFVIDIIMPGMSGDEIIAKLKQEEKTKNIPIVVLSASVVGNEVKKIESLGVTAFYDKTQTIPSQLSKIVRNILEK